MGQARRRRALGLLPPPAERERVHWRLRAALVREFRARLAGLAAQASDQGAHVPSEDEWAEAVVRAGLHFLDAAARAKARADRLVLTADEFADERSSRPLDVVGLPT